jgi:hypothetical protein
MKSLYNNPLTGRSRPIKEVWHLQTRLSQRIGFQER